MILSASLPANSKEREKFEQLYQLYHGPLFYYAQSILKNHANAEEAVQETYLRILHNIEKIGEADSKETKYFLLTILKRVCFSLYKKNKAEAYPIDLSEYFDGDEEPSGDDTTWEGYSLAELQEKLSELIQGLKEEDRNLLILRIWKGFSERQIAELFNITENNVAVRISRIRKKLKKGLSGSFSKDI